MKQKTLYIYILLGIFICLFRQYSTAQNIGGSISLPTAPSLSLKVGSRDSVCLSYMQGAATQSKNYVTLHVSQPLRMSVTVKSTTFIKNNNEVRPIALGLNLYAPDNATENIYPNYNNEKNWTRDVYVTGDYKITYESLGVVNSPATLAAERVVVGPNVYQAGIEITCQKIPRETATNPFPDIPDLPPYLFWNIEDKACRNHVATFEPTISDTEGMTTISYYDGFGKEQENVLVGFVENKKNVVTYQEYDTWGRKGRTWSPMSVDALEGDGFTPLDNIKGLAAGTEPFGYSEYQASPISLETKRFGDGKAWHQAGKAVCMDYFTNKEGNDSLNCMHLEANIDNGNVNFKRIGNYKTGCLMVTRTTDEDGRATFIFKDSFDRTLLTRRKLTVNGQKSFLDTYYIYDKIDQLVAVVPPTMAKFVENDFLPKEMVDAYVYAYEYDDLGRNIAKKLPGCEWTYMAYDRHDRIVYSQDGNKRKEGRLAFLLYDAFGRECVRGTCKGTSVPDIAQADITCKYTGGNKELLGYDCPNWNATDVKVQAVNYYDNYNFLKNRMTPNMFQASYGKTEDYAAKYDCTQGLCTGSVRKILGQEQDGGVYSVCYYDALGRVAQKRTFNNAAQNEVTYYKYAITDDPIRMRHEYGNTNPSVEVYEYTYDKAKRLLKETLALNGATPMVICENEYDDLGRLATRMHAQNPSLNTFYEYNNRSWLTGIESPLYRERLLYNENVSNKQYSGKIARMDWATQRNKSRNYYQFYYDDLGRTTKAYYGMRRFSELFEYDLMGNVTKLKRGGNDDDGTPCAIDDLTLKYHGNQLLKVTDSNEGPYYKGAFHFVDGTDEDVEYAYDANGNMTMDLNKGIESITYNDLNLPKCVTFKLKDDLTQTETEKKIEYFYDSDGGKRAVLYSNDDYIAYTENRVFENDKLKYLLFEGGYASFENGEKNPTFHFYIKDHLGNNRIVADAQGNVEQENHYYPSGTLIMGSKFTQDITSKQRYRFGGKELDRMYGLDWYYFGARMYDPVLNCWTTMDPLCEKYYDISPYVYCNNDLINKFDPNGMDQYEINGLGAVVNIIKDDEKDTFYRVNKTEDGAYYRTGACLVLPYSSVSQYNEAKDNENVPYSVFIMNNIAAGKSLFEFFADNTSVEWTQYSLSDSKGNSFSTVSSSHQDLYDASGGALQNWIFESGLSVKEHSHNHPKERPVEMPSGLLPNEQKGDIDFARKLNYKLQMANKAIPTYKLYVNKKYIYWNENSKPTDFGRAADGTWLPTLPEIVCKP